MLAAAILIVLPLIDACRAEQQITAVPVNAEIESGTQPTETRTPDTTMDALEPPTHILDPLTHIDIKSVKWLYYGFSTFHNLNVFGVPYSGSHVVRLTEASDRWQAYIQPDAWTSDGKQFLIFASSTSAPGFDLTSIYQVNSLDGSYNKILEFSERPFWLKQYPNYDKVIWSPDSRRIAFSAYDPAAQAAYLAVYDFENERIEKLESAPSSSRISLQPIGWSSDGVRIVYVSNGVDGNIDTGTSGVPKTAVYSFDMRTKRIERLYEFDSEVKSAVAVDSRLIVEISDPHESGYPFQGHLLLIDLDSLASEDLIDSGRAANDIHYALSSDRSKLAYTFVTRDLKARLCIRGLIDRQDNCLPIPSIDTSYQSNSAQLWWLPDSENLIASPYLVGAEFCMPLYTIASSGMSSERMLLPAELETPDSCQLFALSWKP